MKITTKITLYTAILVAITSSILVLVGYREISHAFYQQILKDQETRMRVAHHLIDQLGTPIHAKDDKLFAGNILLNDNSQLIEQITSLVGGTATIFRGDRRIATNLRLPDGSRAIGTTMTSGLARKTLFEEHHHFRGEASIFGEPYITSYDLIRDVNGQVIGLVQVGTKKSAYSSALNRILLWSFLVSLVGMGLVGFVVYLTLKSLTSELQKMASRRKLLLESTGEGIYGVDMKGCCTFINNTGAEILGYSIEEMIGQKIHALIHHSYSTGRPYDLAECKLCGSPSEKVRKSDEVFWRKDGGLFPARFLSSPIIQKGVVEGSVVAFNDITERKRAEMEIQQTLIRTIYGR